MPYPKSETGTDDPRVVWLFTHRPVALVDAREDLFETFRKQRNAPTFGERLVDWFRYRGDLLTGILIGVVLGSLGVCAIAYCIRGWVS